MWGGTVRNQGRFRMEKLILAITRLYLIQSLGTLLLRKRKLSSWLLLVPLSRKLPKRRIVPTNCWPRPEWNSKNSVRSQELWSTPLLSPTTTTHLSPSEGSNPTNLSKIQSSSSNNVSRRRDEFQFSCSPTSKQPISSTLSLTSHQAALQPVEQVT